MVEVHPARAQDFLKGFDIKEAVAVSHGQTELVTEAARSSFGSFGISLLVPFS